MEVQVMMKMLRDCLNAFDEQLAEQGYRGDDDVDAEECVDDFKIMVDECLQEAIAKEEREDY